MPAEKSNSLLGALGVDGVIEVLYSPRIKRSYDVKVRAEKALDRGWENIMNLMRHGGAISLNGDILYEGVQQDQLPTDMCERLQKELVVGVSPHDFSKWTGIDGRMPAHWNNIDWGIQLIAQGFEQHLGYSLTRGNQAMPHLVLSNGSIRKGSYLRGLRTAFGNHLDKEYDNELVQKLIHKGPAVTQLLVDIANKYGRGKIG